MSKKGKLSGGEGWSFEPASRRAGPEPAAPSPSRRSAKITVEKRAKGKIVTILSGFALAPDEVKKLARDLKNTCGAGGSSGSDFIEIQGDHRETVANRLSVLGWGNDMSQIRRSKPPNA